MSIMGNMELWCFQTFLDLIVKYLRPLMWLIHPNNGDENQSMLLGGLAYTLGVNYNRQIQNYYQGIMFILGVTVTQHHLTVKDILW